METSLCQLTTLAKSKKSLESSWLQTLGLPLMSQLMVANSGLSIIPNTLGTCILTANVAYGIILLEYTNESEGNTGITYHVAGTGKKGSDILKVRFSS